MVEEKMTRQQIQPGKCPPEGCPPFDRIECIVVDKVYDSCFQVDDISRETIITTGAYMEFETGTFNEGDILGCKLTPGEEITCTEISRTEVDETGFFTITLLITVPVTLINPNNEEETIERTFNFTKTVTLCCPEEVSPDCTESTIISCICVVTNVEEDSIRVMCGIQVCLVIKCILKVQLLVPSYGFCVPAHCLPLPGVCPPTPPEQCF
ncbi:MAG: hypothetical protein PWP31_408 [Clostridia bacterium]|nr:hypothetical protein [Clostridia bacterium]